MEASILRQARALNIFDLSLFSLFSRLLSALFYYSSFFVVFLFFWYEMWIFLSWYFHLRLAAKWIFHVKCANATPKLSLRHKQRKRKQKKEKEIHHFSDVAMLLPSDVTRSLRHHTKLRPLQGDPMLSLCTLLSMMSGKQTRPLRYRHGAQGSPLFLESRDVMP